MLVAQLLMASLHNCHCRHQNSCVIGCDSVALTRANDVLISIDSHESVSFVVIKEFIKAECYYGWLIKVHGH